MDKKRTIKTQKTILFLGLKCNSTLEKSEIHTVQLIFVSLGQPVEKIMKILAIFILLTLTAIIPECIIRLSSKRRGRYLKNYLSKFANILYVVTKLQMGAQLQYLRTFFFFQILILFMMRYSENVCTFLKKSLNLIIFQILFGKI